MTTVRCECGGALRATRLKFYDFSAFAGFHVTLSNVDGFRCSSCKGETIGGELVDRTIRHLGLAAGGGQR